MFEEVDVIIFDKWQEFMEEKESGDEDEDDDEDQEDENSHNNDNDGSGPSDEDVVELFEQELMTHLERFGEIYLTATRYGTKKTKHNFKFTTIDHLFNYNKQAWTWLIETSLGKIIHYKLYLTEECEFGLKFYIIHYFAMILFLLFDENAQTKKSRASNLGSSSSSKNLLVQHSRYGTAMATPASTPVDVNGPADNGNNKHRNNNNNNSAYKPPYASKYHKRSRSTGRVYPRVLGEDCPFKDELRPLYELMKEFGQYNVCYPRHKREEESFYLQMFSKCKDVCRLCLFCLF